MKGAAAVLGIIGGVLGLILGLAVAGWIAFTGWVNAEVSADAIEPLANASQLKLAGVLAPVLAIAGGAMSVLRPFIGAGLLILAASGMYWAFGFGFFSMFPVVMCAAAGLFGLAGAATREPGGMPPPGR
jgi:hypothetical protein